MLPLNTGRAGSNPWLVDPWLRLTARPVALAMHARTDPRIRYALAWLGVMWSAVVERADWASEPASGRESLGLSLRQADLVARPRPCTLHRSDSSEWPVPRHVPCTECRLRPGTAWLRRRLRRRWHMGSAAAQDISATWIRHWTGIDMLHAVFGGIGSSSTCAHSLGVAIGGWLLRRDMCSRFVAAASMCCLLLGRLRVGLGSLGPNFRPAKRKNMWFTASSSRQVWWSMWSSMWPTASSARQVGRSMWSPASSALGILGSAVEHAVSLLSTTSFVRLALEEHML